MNKATTTLENYVRLLVNKREIEAEEEARLEQIRVNKVLDEHNKRLELSALMVEIMRDIEGLAEPKHKGQYICEQDEKMRLYCSAGVAFRIEIASSKLIRVGSFNEGKYCVNLTDDNRDEFLNKVLEEYSSYYILGRWNPKGFLDLNDDSE